MPTIKDVARHCNVSFKTVSNVINDHPNVSVAMREKVLKAIGEVGYYPSESARRLVHRKRSHQGEHAGYVPRQLQIGCVTDATIDHYGNPFYLKLFRGMESQLSQNGHILSFVQSDMALIDDPLLYNYFFDANRIHGVITFHRFKSFVQRMSQDFPVVSIGDDHVGVDHVVPNLKEAVEIALNHLFNLGHREIGFVGVKYHTAERKVIRDRYAAYEQWIKQHDLQLAPHWIMDTPEFDVPSGSEAFEKMLQADRLPSAIFCASDELAYGVMMKCREKKIRIPEDISVIGIDNLNTSQLVYPALTTVEIDSEQMGRQAVSMMIQRIHNPKSSTVSYVQSSKLIERDSCRHLQSTI